MNGLLKNVLRQHYVGYWWGGVKMSLQQTAIYITVINFVLLSITAYDTGWVQQYIIDVNYVQFFLILVGLGVLPSLLVVFKVDMPSFFAFWWKQSWAQDNPLKDELDGIRRGQEALAEQVAELSRNINERNIGE